MGDAIRPHLYDAAAGTAALPSYTFLSDRDTGFYRAAANQLGVALGGAAKLLYSAGTFAFQEATNITTTTGAITMTPLAGQALNIVLSGVGDLVVNTSQFVVDTSEARVGIGTATPGFILDVQSNVAADAIVIQNAATSPHPIFRGRSSRGSVGSETATQVNDVLVSLVGSGYGTGFADGAYVSILATEIWTATARGSKINFLTVDNTTTTQDIRMTIDQNGSVTLTGTLGVTGNRVSNIFTTSQTTTNAETVDSWGLTKQHITPYDDALAVLRGISVVAYEHKRAYDPSGRRKLGVLAETVGERLATPFDEYVGLGQGPRLDMLGLAAINTRAIQQVDNEVEMLRQRVASLERELATLRAGD